MEAAAAQCAGAADVEQCAEDAHDASAQCGDLESWLDEAIATPKVQEWIKNGGSVERYKAAYGLGATDHVQSATEAWKRRQQLRSDVQAKKIAPRPPPPPRERPPPPRQPPPPLIHRPGPPPLPPAPPALPRQPPPPEGEPPQSPPQVRWPGWPPNFRPMAGIGQQLARQHFQQMKLMGAFSEMPPPPVSEMTPPPAGPPPPRRRRQPATPPPEHSLKRKWQKASGPEAEEPEAEGPEAEQPEAEEPAQRQKCYLRPKSKRRPSRPS